MRFYRYWMRADVPVSDRRTVTGWGFSDVSEEDALEVARKRAETLAALIASGRRPADRYYGTDRPLREEVLEEVTDKAIVSRNSYGARILNTVDVLFADVDLPSRRGLFVRRRRRDNFESGLVERISQSLERDPGLRLRLYRTAGGYRVLLTSRRVQPSAAKSTALLDQFGSDTMYVSLCRTQDSYRARLSPKPWRMGMARPPARYPYGDAEPEFRRWEQQYESAATRFATCELVGTYGTAPEDEEAAEIAEVHDATTLNPGAPLA